MNTLKGLLVENAMQRQVIDLPATASITKAVDLMTRYKIDALLLRDERQRAVGVVSKTDIMGAYYATLPLSTKLHDIMSSPALFCDQDTPLESALDKMRDARIHRLYVGEKESERVVGTLSYPGIVWLMHNYCQECEYGLLRRNKQPQKLNPVNRIIVKEVMTTSVKSSPEDEPLTRIMEDLSSYHFGALLIVDNRGAPRGVISKTDLAISYWRNLSPEIPAEKIMSSPVCSSNASDMLENAVSEMMHNRVSRLFIHDQESQNIIGVLSLSDAARVRSGSCLACTSTRIKVEK
jgi:CBS domain-containing protein